jgi:polyhydroxybutyrate depolymerase
MRPVTLLSLLLCACAVAPQTDPPPDRVLFGGDRPVTLRVPPGYDHARPTPLVVVLHGYGANGLVQEAYFGFDRLAEEEDILVAAPDGSVSRSGPLFWNATESCCDFADERPDDSGYLAALIREISATYNVDRRRVYLVGHSNGGFMSYRLACDHADLVAAFVSLAGAAFPPSQAADCRPSSRVSVLQVHGTLDDTILYEGNTGEGFVGRYPGAASSVAQWAERLGCTGGLVDAEARLDLDAGVRGPETRVARTAGCPAGTAADLWTIDGGAHLPGLRPEWRAHVWAWLAAHPKP